MGKGKTTPFMVESEKELNALYQSLTKNATNGSTYPLKTGGSGTTKILEDGTRIKFKETSGTGGATIEIETSAGNIKQHIHIVP